MSGKPGVFLDRDGTLNEEVDYLHDPDELMLIPGAARAVARLNARGVPVVVVTNQSGIGRGYYGFDEFNRVMARMSELLADEGARLDAVYVSPHHEKGQGAFAHPDHPERKPNAGMLTRAALEHGLDISNSWMIGDKESDLEAGRRAGCHVALVRTGYGRGVEGSLADLVAENLQEAVDRILEAWP
ncbi:MAG: HAD family hydrolase [Acidobacteriota bacterium]|nr:HAD family hydrolase [Acidobacteriota bacterium]